MKLRLTRIIPILVFCSLTLLMSRCSTDMKFNNAKAAFSEDLTFGNAPNEKTKDARKATIMQQLSVRSIFEKGITFTENKGQLKRFHDVADSKLGDIKYYTRSFGGTAYFMPKGIGFGFLKNESTSNKNSSESPIYNSINFNLLFDGANSDVSIISENKQPGILNYFVGPSENHVNNIASYETVSYKNLYANIDLKYYENNGSLKYDYLIHPAGEVSDISMHYEGIKNAVLNEQGELEIETSWGVLKDAAPYSYQLINGSKQEIDVRYTLSENGNIGFKVFEEYDRSKTLVIDPPTLEWASLVGTNTGYGYLMDIEIDADGNIYGTGNHNTGFAANSQNSFESTIHGGDDPFVFKLSSDGTTLLYAGYVGGDGGIVNERSWGIAVNSNGEAYIAGHVSEASRFPFTSGVVQNTIAGGIDMFVTKINAAGTALAYSTFYGGAGEDRAYSIDVDSAGNAYVTGATTSSASFSSGSNIEQSTYAGALDAFVLRLNSDASAVDFCTYLGGTGDDLGRSIAVNNTGIYITGASASSSGVAKTGAADASFAGGAADAFICKFDFDGSQTYGTYIGGSDEDKGEDIAVKPNGEAIISGYTRSTFSQGFPSVNPVQTDNKGLRDAFVTRVSADGSSVLSSTFMGTAQEENLRNSTPFVLDPAQKAAGVDVSANGEIAFVLTTATTGLPTVNAITSTPQGGSVGLGDAYLCVLSSDGDSIIFSTYFGGSANDYTTGGVKFNGNSVYLAGSSHSPSLPTTAGVYQATRSGGGDIPFVVKYSCIYSTELDTPSTVNTCNYFVLPEIAGNFLSGNEAYFVDSIGTGLMPGDTIFSTSTIHILDSNNKCMNQVKFDVNILEATTINSLPDSTYCEYYVLPSIEGINLTGNEAYFIDSTGTKLDNGDTIFQSSTIHILDTFNNCLINSKFSVEIEDCPPPPPVDSCILSVPNAFTPDGDGVNDVWNIGCISEYPDAVVKVYNRWGTIVHETTGANYVAWDGSELPVGSFVYTIELNDGSSENMKGTLTLVR